MQFWKRAPKRLYLDFAAATPLSFNVRKVMRAVEDMLYGNPGAIHKEGQMAKEAVSGARAKLARTLGIRPNEVIFTGSGTEANNLAIIGFIKAHKVAEGDAAPCEVISTTVEHPSVEEVLKVLETEGIIVHRVDVDEEGMVDPKDIAALLSPHTVLVTLAYANSEVGTVQPVTKIARLIRKYNTTHATDIKTHIDAAQAPLWLPCQLHALGVDMMSLDAGKCYGPKGVGVLAKLTSVPLAPIFYGGGQEFGMRPATENVVGIVGAAEAIEAAQKGRVQRVEAVKKSSAALRAALEDLPGIYFNGAKDARLPHNVHISLPGIDTEYAVVWLDCMGIAASTKSACSGAGGGRSEVVWQMTHDAARAASTIRFTIDPTIDPTQLSRVATALKDFIAIQTDA